jgi:hypothetical protein
MRQSFSTSPQVVGGAHDPRHRLDVVDADDIGSA